jgi:hypothetical protein
MNILNSHLKNPTSTETRLFINSGKDKFWKYFPSCSSKVTILLLFEVQRSFSDGLNILFLVSKQRFY